MPIEFFCQTCNSKLRTPDETAGKMVRCPKCGQLSRIPHDQFVSATEERSPEPVSATEQTTRRSDIARPDQGRWYEGGKAFEPASEFSTSNPYSPPLADRNIPTYHYQPSSASISARLLPPGITLIVVASLILIFALLGVIGFVSQVIRAGVKDDDIPAIILVSIGLLLSLVALVGGIAMIRKRGYILAIAGSISIILVGVFCCFLPVPVGVWALVALTTNDTKSAFR